MTMQHTPLTCSACDARIERALTIAGRKVCEDCAVRSLGDLLDDLMDEPS